MTDIARPRRQSRSADIDLQIMKVDFYLMHCCETWKAVVLPSCSPPFQPKSKGLITSRKWLLAPAGAPYAMVPYLTSSAAGHFVRFWPFMPTYRDFLFDWQWLCHWLMLIHADSCWYWLMPIDDDWCWLILIYADWLWLMLIDADWCWLMLIDADWWWLMSTDVDWCW